MLWSPAPGFAAACLLLFLLMGCDRPADKLTFLSTDITGSDFGADFRLTDYTGKVRTLADFKGKVVVLFFGYTHCPDVCPITLAEMAAVMKKLGLDAEKVQVLFLTIDPERDTPDLLRTYVPSFHPSFLGLHGDAEATARVAKEFKVFYQKQPRSRPDQYTMDHSAGTYVFDTFGRIRLFVAYGRGVDVFAHDIRMLLSSSPRTYDN